MLTRGGSLFLRAALRRPVPGRSPCRRLVAPYPALRQEASALPASESWSNFFLDECLDRVSGLDVLIPVETDAAVESCPDFGDVILEPSQGTDLALVNHDVVSQEPDRCAAGDRTFDNMTPGDDA